MPPIESVVDEIKNMLHAAVPTPGHVGLMAGVQTPDIDLTYIPAGTIAYPSGTPAADEPNPDTPFRLASCTKPFAAALYGYASVMQGMVTAADTVQDYLPALGPLTALELSTLADYGSGLPADNRHNPGTAPTHWAYPYQVSDMTTFLDENAISINAMIGVQRAKPNILRLFQPRVRALDVRGASSPGLPDATAALRRRAVHPAGHDVQRPGPDRRCAAAAVL